MGINNDSDRAASLVIGPTSLGMVRIYVESDGIELPMDFEPDEALDIANELRAAAEIAMATAGGGASGTPGMDKGDLRAENGGRKPDRKTESKRGGGGRRG